MPDTVEIRDPSVARPSDDKKSIYLYNRKWAAEGFDPVATEITMVAAGGYIVPKNNPDKKCGLGLFFHFKRLMQLLWPEDDHHEWSDLILKHYLEEKYTIVVGPKDTGKTHCWARIVLADYWTWPQETLWLISSTDMRGLELRIWGDIKDLFNRARERWPRLAGNILESKHGIFTDSIDKDEARDIRKGLICIPCIGGQGEWIGLEKYIGIKQKRRRLLGDELQFMRAPYLVSLEHLDKGDFKMGGSGNPIAQMDPLDRLGEPEMGWGTEPQTEKTEVWRNKWGGITINIDGRDTLNNREPKNLYPYLLNQQDIDRTAKRYGTDSATYWTQVVGKRKTGLLAHRVLTLADCRRNGSFEPCVWSGEPTIKIYALDAAYGGDRAVGGPIECGREVGGRNIIKVHTPRVIPVSIADNMPSAEEQLAFAVRTDCLAAGIPPENVFFEAGMRATLAIKMAQIFSNLVNAVNAGGPATKRPVSNDDFIIDRETGQKRLRRCDETYSKFITEIWFSVRKVSECRQLRELPEDVAREFEMREWIMVAGDKYELETKEDTKKRMGQSPDLADWLSIGVEGARRLGFLIERLPNKETEGEENDWLEREHAKYRAAVRKTELNYRT